MKAEYAAGTTITAAAGGGDLLVPRYRTSTRALRAFLVGGQSSRTSLSSHAHVSWHQFKLNLIIFLPNMFQYIVNCAFEMFKSAPEKVGCLLFYDYLS